MKGKIKLLGHIGLMLFLVSALMLAVAPVAQAATSVTNVWVQFTTSTYNQTNTASDFTIHFTPTTALSRGVDKITVWFPDGSTAMGPDNFSLASASSSATYYVVDRDGEAITYSATDCTDDAVLSTSGYRITVVTPVSLDAGTPCSLRIEAAAGVACADGTSHDQYYIKVYTSKDTTPVASDAFDIDASTDAIAAVSLALSPDTAGAAGQYTFTVNTTSATALTAAAEDTLTFIFPYGITMPSSIAADKVSISNDGGASWSTSTVDPVVNQKARMVTVRTPITLAVHATNNLVRFSTGASILNPTVVKGSPYYTDCFCFTSQDELQVAETDGYDVTAGTATKLGFNNDAYPSSSYSDSATMINMYSDVLYVQLQDQYGNVKVISGTEPTVNFSSSSGTGLFFESGPTQISSKLLVSGLASIYYRDSAAGTVTLTASHASYTSGTCTMIIVPGVGLYDSNNNLIKTYAPTSTSPATEGATVHSGDYVQNAIDASVAGDTVKLGDGTYELDTAISVSKKITLTSVNGASSTTIKPYSDGIDAVNIAVTGTATNPVIIDGLTFARLRSGTEFDQGIFNNGYNYVTVRNCVFNYIIPANVSDNEYGAVVGFVLYPPLGGADANITSATISNNTFTNCCSFGFTTYGEQAANINVMTKSMTTDRTITGATVSGNTLTDCNGIGIFLRGNTTNRTVTASVTDNTITNAVYPISLCGYTSGISILRNTITGGYMQGIWVEPDDHNDLVIKNNTITGCAATGCSGWGSYSAAILIHADEGGSPTTANIIQYNAIYSNDATYSIYVASTSLSNQDCKYNWFGDATGPYYSALTGASVAKSNTGGAGKKVSDYVTYYPWLHKSLADVVADNVSYQACNMRLVSGWNTLSTPVKLISTADAINELIPSGMTIGYYYDATGWQQITTGYVLNPCNAVYVRMSIATDVLLKFDASAFSAPSKTLSAGWNLISLAYLGSSGQTDLATVASVAKTAAGLPGYSQLVSPSINATQTDMYGTARTSWAYAYGQTGGVYSCYAGLGYWVYMQNAATLAGFEITPIAPDLD
jgi:hypothetical protein